MTQSCLYTKLHFLILPTFNVGVAFFLRLLSFQMLDFTRLFSPPLLLLVFILSFLHVLLSLFDPIKLLRKSLLSTLELMMLMLVIIAPNHLHTSHAKYFFFFSFEKKVIAWALL